MNLGEKKSIKESLLLESQILYKKDDHLIVIDSYGFDYSGGFIHSNIPFKLFYFSNKYQEISMITWFFEINSGKRKIHTTYHEFEITVFKSGVFKLDRLDVIYTNEVSDSILINKEIKVLCQSPVLNSKISSISKIKVNKVGNKKPRIFEFITITSAINIEAIIDKHNNELNLTDEEKIKITYILKNLIFLELIKSFSDGNKKQIQNESWFEGFFREKKFNNLLDINISPTSATMILHLIAKGDISIDDIDEHRKNNWKGAKKKELIDKNIKSLSGYESTANMTRIGSINIYNTIYFLKNYCDLTINKDDFIKELKKSCLVSPASYKINNSIIDFIVKDHDHNPVYHRNSVLQYNTLDSIELVSHYSWGSSSRPNSRPQLKQNKKVEYRISTNINSYSTIISKKLIPEKSIVVSLIDIIGNITTASDKIEIAIDFIPDSSEDYPNDYLSWKKLGDPNRSQGDVWKKAYCTLILNLTGNNDTSYTIDILMETHDNKASYKDNKLVIDFGIVPLWAKSKKVTNPEKREWNKTKKIPYKPEIIVIHHLGVYKAGTALWKKSGNSVHYILRRNGEFIKLVHEDNRANHSGMGKSSYWGKHDYTYTDTTTGTPTNKIIEVSQDVDVRSIGFEIEHFNENFSSEQYHSLISQISGMENEYNISPRNIVGHDEVGLKDGYLKLKDCPSTHFDWRVLELHGVSLDPKSENGVPLTGYLQSFFGSDSTQVLKDSASNNSAIEEFLIGLAKIGYKVNTHKKLKFETNKRALGAFRKRYLSHNHGQIKYIDKTDYRVAKIYYSDARMLKSILSKIYKMNSIIYKV